MAAFSLLRATHHRSLPFTLSHYFPTAATTYTPFFPFSKVTLLPPSPNNYTNTRPSPTYPGTGWANTEFRSYTFRPGVNDEDLLGKKVGGDNAPLVETEASRLMRGKEVEAPSRELQCQFFNQAITGWNNQNAQNLKDLEDEDAAKHKETVDVVDAGEKVQKVIEISD